jgi:hypothetical protein
VTAIGWPCSQRVCKSSGPSGLATSLPQSVDFASCYPPAEFSRNSMVSTLVVILRLGLHAKDAVHSRRQFGAVISMSRKVSLPYAAARLTRAIVDGHGLLLVGSPSGLPDAKRVVLPEQLAVIVESLLRPSSRSLPGFPLIDTSVSVGLSSESSRARFPGLDPAQTACRSLLHFPIAQDNEPNTARIAMPPRLAVELRLPSSTSQHQPNRNSAAGEPVVDPQLEELRLEGVRPGQHMVKATSPQTAGVSIKSPFRLLYAGPDTWAH